MKCITNQSKSTYAIKNLLEKYYKLRNLENILVTKKKVSINELKINSLLNLYIEPTNRCNLSCYFCAREKMTRKPMDLTLEQFNNIVQSLPAGFYITLTGNGEPLLNRNIYEMVKIASSNNIFVSIITNATALTEKNARKLIENGISRIQFSFDSIDRQTFEIIRKGANYKDTLLKILRFILLVRKEYKADIFISVTSVQTDEVTKYNEVSRKFWERIPIDNYFESPVFSLQTDSKAYSELVLNDEQWMPCVGPFITAKIDADGNVTGCHHDFSGKHIIGNCQENSIFEILNSTQGISFRKALFQDDQSYLKKIGYDCLGCNVWRKGNGYGLREYLHDTFPKILSLKVSELNSQNIFSSDSIQYLEEVIQYVEKI